MDLWTIGILVGNFVAGLVVGFLAKRKKKNNGIPTTHDEIIFATLHGNIRERLSELRVNTQAGRATIAQFHNGSNYVDGPSMRKFSYTHQSFAVGVASTVEGNTQVIASHMIEFLLMIWEDKPRLRWVDAMPEGLSRLSFSSQNTVAFSVLPLKSMAGNFTVGFILLEWDDRDLLAELEFEEVEKLTHETRDVISMLLSKRKG